MLQRYRSIEFSQPPPSIRRRVGSTQFSPSPGPSQSWRGFPNYPNYARGSVAVAPQPRRDSDTASHNFSLAGPTQTETLAANQPYVDPGYAQLNPAYEQPANIRPVWGLAKPLPHVLRPGMVPTKDEVRTELLQHQQDEQDRRTEVSADLESVGRIEPTLRPNVVIPHLESVRREREIQLLESFQQRHLLSPGTSPFGGRTRRASGTDTEAPDQSAQPRIDETIVEEDEEHQQQQHSKPHERLSEDIDVSHLSEAIATVKQAKEEEEEDFDAPYQDAVPLLAYEPEDDEIHNLHTYWSVIRLRFREPLAELLAVCNPFDRFAISFTHLLNR